MKNFKTYSAIAAGLMFTMALLMVTTSESKSPADDVLKRLATVCYNQAQAASWEASRAAEKQRTLIGKAIGNSANDGEDARPQPERLTAREVAREKAVLQQLEANARRAAEVLESVKRLATELEHKAPR